MTAQDSHTDKFTLRKRINHRRKRESDLLFIRFGLPMVFIMPNINIFKENASGELTIFLDLILTKYFLEIDVRKC